MINDMRSSLYWKYLNEDLKELLNQASLLLSTAEKWEAGLPKDVDRFHDYAFIIFPAAKAYEGFLKTLFFDLGFISKSEFNGKRLRIGKSLNPLLYSNEMKRSSRYKKLRKKISIYDKMEKYCGGSDLANTLWVTWKECRNELFHWHPNERNAIDLDEARHKLQKILDSMNMAFKECKIDIGT